MSRTFPNHDGPLRIIIKVTDHVTNRPRLRYQETTPGERRELLLCKMVLLQKKNKMRRERDGGILICGERFEPAKYITLLKISVRALHREHCSIRFLRDSEALKIKKCFLVHLVVIVSCIHDNKDNNDHSVCKGLI